MGMAHAKDEEPVGISHFSRRSGLADHTSDLQDLQRGVIQANSVLIVVKSAYRELRHGSRFGQ